MRQANLDRPLCVVPSVPFRLDVQSFLADCRARNLSPKTQRIYAETLTVFQKWTTRQRIEEVTPGDLRAYLVHLQDTGHNPGGTHQHYRVLKTFFRWLLAEEVIETNPMARVKPPKLPQELLDPVPLADVSKMLATCDKSFTGHRDRAVLLALLDTGCRATEFVALNMADVNLSSGAVIVRQGKGGKFRTVFLGARSRRDLLRYLRLRGELGDGPLWVTTEGSRLTYAGLRQIVRRRANWAGVAEPCLHSFRRAFALACLRNGVDLISLQRLMGHADLSVLKRYLAQVEADLQLVGQLPRGLPLHCHSEERSDEESRL